MSATQSRSVHKKKRDTDKWLDEDLLRTLRELRLRLPEKPWRNCKDQQAFIDTLTASEKEAWAVALDELWFRWGELIDRGETVRVTGGYVVRDCNGKLKIEKEQ